MALCSIIFLMPWSVLYIWVFLQLSSLKHPIITCPYDGGVRDNIHQWVGNKCLHVYWDLTCMYLKEDGYITYVVTRKGNSLEEYVDEIEDHWELLKSTKEWWVELK